ncbi:unnamed protein product [Vicia faba]|uniref:Uncharacterized protein n=1 Tax=Vicia faba TaxID=3906 RepID=A0AAV1B3T4_VICFA|nr:unnamed protein product [Vicia faba]
MLRASRVHYDQGQFEFLQSEKVTSQMFRTLRNAENERPSYTAAGSIIGVTNEWSPASYRATSEGDVRGAVVAVGLSSKAEGSKVEVRVGDRGGCPARKEVVGGRRSSNSGKRKDWRRNLVASHEFLQTSLEIGHRLIAKLSRCIREIL